MGEAMTAYDELLRDLLVERYRPVPPPRRHGPDRLAALARALAPAERPATRKPRRSTSQARPEARDGTSA
jgi:hypothetical protein